MTLEVRELRHEGSAAFRLGPVTLSVQTEVLGIVGRNGAGKSTLMRLLSTASAPSSGRLALDGSVVSRAQRRGYRRQLGYLPQAMQLPGRASVRQFLHHAAWLREVPRAQRTGGVEDAIEAVDLGDEAERAIRTLSGGTQRRVALAQALVNRPRVLLLDEPTNGLDPEQRLIFREHVRRLSETTSVLLATHLVEDVRSLAQRVLVLRSGEVAYLGPVDDVPGGAAVDRDALESRIARLISGGSGAGR